MKHHRYLAPVALSLALLGISYQAEARTLRAVPPAATRCTEDMPCWNWATMGNGRRGIVTMWGTPKVVTCGGMRHLVKTRNLDPYTRRLRGDGMCGRTLAYDRRMKRLMEEW